MWYDNDKKKDNFTAYKLLIADVVDGELRAVPRGGVMAAAAVMQGSRGGGVDLPENDIDRVKKPPRQVLQEDG